MNYVAKLDTRLGTALLDESGMWSSSSKGLERLLNSACGAGLYPSSPAEGSGSRREQVRAAIRPTGGVVEYLVGGDVIEGRVY